MNVIMNENGATDECPFGTLETLFASMFSLDTRKRRRVGWKGDKSVSAFIPEVDPADPDLPYDGMLRRVYMMLAIEHPEMMSKRRTKLQPPRVQCSGGRRKKSFWMNAAETANSLHRDVDHMMKWFGEEYKMKTTISGSTIIFNGAIFVTEKMIELGIRSYVTKFVICTLCKGIDSTISRDHVTRLHTLHCETCGASKTINLDGEA